MQNIGQGRDSITFPVLWCSLTFFYNRIEMFDGKNIEKNSCRAEREPIVHIQAGRNEASVGGRCISRYLDSDRCDTEIMGNYKESTHFLCRIFYHRQE